MTTLLCGACFHASQPGTHCSHCGAALVERGAPGALRVGTVLDGKFVVGNVLGAPGGFGIAYLGWDRVLQRKVVIKELFPDGLVTRAAGSTKRGRPHAEHATARSSTCSASCSWTRRASWRGWTAWTRWRVSSTTSPRTTPPTS
jgi:serine/threonine protein kinase